MNSSDILWVVEAKVKAVGKDEWIWIPYDDEYTYSNRKSGREAVKDLKKHFNPNNTKYRLSKYKRVER